MKIRKLIRVHADERGITGLETAIILIAFVVVAAVFAYTTLSSGLFATQKSKQAINAGLNETQSTIELKGDVIAYERDSSKVGKISFNVVNAVPGGDPIDLTPAYSYDGTDLTATADNARMQISYSDATVSIAQCPWTLSWVGKNNSDNFLDDGEQAVITVWLHNYATSAWADGASGTFLAANYLTTYEQFQLEVKPATGATLSIQRTIPAKIDTVMDLH